MNIKKIRESANLTQEQAAKIANCSQSNYSKYELQKTEPNIETLIRLADFYNVSLDYLCDRQWNNQIGYIPEDKRELVKLVLQLNELNTMRAISYISGMLAIQNN